MHTHRFVFTALLICVIVACGCAKQQQAAAPAAGEEVASLAEASPASVEEEAGLAPPTDGLSFKEQKLADALAGLHYDSGLVEVDRAVAEIMDAVGDKQAAAEEYRKGLYHIDEKHDRVAAIGAFTRAVIMDPEVPAYYVGLGKALLMKGFSQKALAAFGSALELDPDNLEARVHVAWALQMRGRYDESRRAWERVIDIDSNNGQAYGRMAMIDYYTFEYAAAWDNVHRAQGLGYTMPAQFLPLLRAKMAEPAG